jgi:hypothetical protein
MGYFRKLKQSFLFCFVVSAIVIFPLHGTAQDWGDPANARAGLNQLASTMDNYCIHMSVEGLGRLESAVEALWNLEIDLETLIDFSVDYDVDPLECLADMGFDADIALDIDLPNLDACIDGFTLPDIDFAGDFDFDLDGIQACFESALGDLDFGIDTDFTFDMDSLNECLAVDVELDADGLIDILSGLSDKIEAVIAALGDITATLDVNLTATLEALLEFCGDTGEGFLIDIEAACSGASTAALRKARRKIKKLKKKLRRLR